MRRKTIIFGLIAVGAVVAFLLWRDPSAKQVLPDGTVLTLSGVKVGSTNVYAHATGLSKILGPFVPSQGIKVAGFRLQRPQMLVMSGPEGAELLTAELSLGPGSTREDASIRPSFNRKQRLLLTGDADDGFAFVKEFNGFKSQPDGDFAFIWVWSYPRDSHRLHFRLEERETPDSRDWREVTTFVVRNPKPARVESWKPAPSPRLKLADGLEVEVGELGVRLEPINPTDIWEHTAFLTVRVFSNGQLATNWGIQGGTVWDASGNFDSFTYGSSKWVTNGWMEYRIFRPLDPAKVWKFHVGFARDSEFPATNRFSFIVPWLLTGAIQTNLGGFPVRIDFGNPERLSVDLTNKPARTRLTLIQVVDDEGTDLDSGSGSWGQHSFSKILKQGRTGTPTPAQLHVTVAIHENYEAEFMLQPQYEGKRKPKPNP